MKWRISICVLVVLGLLLISGLAQAQLTVIGTAVYNNGTPGDTSDDVTCNLIWDDDNNGNSVIWLDYSHAEKRWQAQMDWAAGLGAALTVTWNPGISVTWSDAAWRLPNTVDGQYVYGCDGTTTGGYNITTSEMGHLYYTELGNQRYRYGSSCDENSPYDLPFGLMNTEPFNNIFGLAYWSGTKFAANSNNFWFFSFGSLMSHYFPISAPIVAAIGCGQQDLLVEGAAVAYGLALRSGQVVNGSIPTLSEWGQILLVVMLGVSALWMKRRQTMMV